MTAWPIGIPRESIILRIQRLGFFIGTLVLFWPSLTWVGQQLASPQHRFQLMGMLVLSGITVYHLVSSAKPRPPLRFAVKSRPLVVFTLGCMAYLLNERYLGINVFSAAFCIIALYGMWGFYNDTAEWRQSTVPAVLLILLLPFGDYLDVYFGFPLRLFTAQVAGDLLSSMGFSTISSDTLIVLENRYANVDLSCSGIKGLWAGLEFFVLLSWIEKKAITAHWLLRLLCFSGVLMAMNIFRVVLLVMLGLGFDQMAFADLLHQSLGVLGFAFACLIGWGLLLTTPSQNVPYTNTESHFVSNIDHHRPAHYVNWLLMLLPISLCFLHTPLPKQVYPTSNSSINVLLPDDWNAQEIALSKQEAEFFPRNAAAAEKFTFQRNRTLQGSVMFVSTEYWKAHHEPKNYLIADGHHITKDKSVRLSSDKTLRVLNLTHQGRSLTALYWFQTTTHSTDDFSARLFASLWDRRQPWVMVSVILDTPNVSAAEVNTVMTTFSTVVDSQIL